MAFRQFDKPIEPVSIPIALALVGLIGISEEQIPSHSVFDVICLIRVVTGPHKHPHQRAYFPVRIHPGFNRNRR